MPRLLRTLLACCLLLNLAAPSKAQTELGFLRARLANHSLIGRLDTNLLHHYPPFVVFYQTPLRADPDRAKKLTDRYGAWLESLAATIHGTFVAPGRVPEPSKPFFVPLYIMDGQAPFRNTGRYINKRSRTANRTAWLPDIDLLVTLHDASDDKRGPGGTRAPVLFELTRSLLNAWCITSIPDIEEQWMLDGLAGYFSSEGVEDVESYPNPPVNPSALKWLNGLNDAEQEHLLLGLDRLVPMGDSEFRHKEFLRVNREAGNGPVSTVATSTIWYHQTNLWAHFLLRGDGGRWRGPFVKYVGNVMRGDRGLETLVEALGVSHLSELDTPYRSHLEALKRGEGVESGPAIAVAVGGDGSTVVTPALAASPEDSEARLAVAMSRAARGDLTSALAELESIEASTDDQALKFKIQAEAERLAVAVKGRNDFLQSLVGTKRKLRFLYGDQKVYAKVLGFEDGSITLEARKEGDLESAEVANISLGDIATGMGRDAEEFGPEWLRGYYLALVGDVKWKRYVDKKSSSGKALIRTLEEDVAGWIEMGAAVLALDDLARQPLSNDAVTAEATLTNIRMTLKDHGRTQAVDHAKPALRMIAEEALRLRFPQEGVRDLLKGKLTPLEGGRVRLEYDFKSPSQLDDFTKDSEYLLKWREDRGALTPAAEKVGYTVRGGQLSGTGGQVFRLKVPFDSPTLKYRFVYGRSSEPGAFASMSLGICDNGKGSYIAAHNALDLEVVDVEGAFQRFEVEQDPKARKVRGAKPIDMELIHDGTKQVTLKAGGKKVREALCGPRKSGDIFIFFHATSPIAIQSLVIEGVPNLAGREEQRDAWVDEQLTEMGL